MIGKITKIDGNKIWVIELGKEEKEYTLEHWIKPEYVKLGEADITLNENMVTFVSMIKDMANNEIKQESKDKKPNFIVNIKGKDFMTYEGLLAKAHEKGKFDMIITESWVSEDMKKAWCKVRLTADGQVFDGFGSSTPDNTGEMTQSHPVEMSHTRAKGRAFRDYLNIGQAMAEEIKQE